MASLILPIACFTFLAVSGSVPAQYQCTLSPVLHPGESFEVAILHRLPAGATPVLPEQPARDSQLFAGEIPIRAGTAVKVAAVVSPALETIWYVDANLDGKFTKEERIRPGVEGQRLDLPVRIGSFKSYPLFVKEQVLTREQSVDVLSKGIWLLLYSRQAEVRGVLELPGRRTQIGYSLDAESGTVDPRNGWVGMDVDGDGSIDETPDNAESASARDETIVFHVGAGYYATRNVNLADLTAQVEERPASEYLMIALKPGSQIPNFSFIDFSGAKRGAHDVKARFTLLYFWASWCMPCREESRALGAIYGEFDRADFDAIGLSSDETLERAVASHGSVRWTEARPDSVEELVRRRFRIQQWPTLILLDSEKRIVSLGREGELPLRGAALRNSLNELLGRSRSGIGTGSFEGVFGSSNGR
jgi:thiol-disulfide isomerase/thioredoxin